LSPSPEGVNSLLAVVNIVDAVLAAVLCVFAVRGYVKGLFREVFALLGLAGGLIVSLRYFQPVSLWVESWPYPPVILQIIVFVFLFFLVYIGFNWLGFQLHRSAGVLFLGGLDRFGGVLVGGSKGALFLGVGLFFAVSQSWLPPNVRQQLDRAASVEPLYRLGATVAVLGSTLRWPGVPGPDSTAGHPQRGA